MAGNEDCGQMSAWFVISALGLYAVDPVSCRYDFGSPLFDRVEVALAAGRKLIIEAKRESPASAYIQSVKWNGAVVPGVSIAHADLAKGGSLVFQLADNPALAS
jgi:putative alpha-1,2-mannosidase